MKKTAFVLSAALMLQLSLGSAAFAKDRLSPSETLLKGQSITSSDGRFALIMQTDGNLVLYMNGRGLWDTNTDGDYVQWYDPFFNRYFTRYPDKFKFTTYGSLEIRDNAEEVIPFWKADLAGWQKQHYGSMGQPVPVGLIGDRLLLQNDGNLVLSDNRGPVSLPVWASNTYGH
jgi:hypothetical protein